VTIQKHYVHTKHVNIIAGRITSRSNLSYCCLFWEGRENGNRVWLYVYVYRRVVQESKSVQVFKKRLKRGEFIVCLGKGKGKSKCKSKVHPRIGHEGPDGENMYTLPSTSALDGVGGQRHVPAALLPGGTQYKTEHTLPKHFLCFAVICFCMCCVCDVMKFNLFYL
jgi:hypothetical protein